MHVLVGPEELKNYKKRYSNWNADRLTFMMEKADIKMTTEVKEALRTARTLYETHNPEPKFFPEV